MTRLLALVADHWLLVALGGVLLAAIVLVGFGRRPRVWWPVLAALLVAGHFLFQFVRLWGLAPWELAAWAALGVIGLFVLAGSNLVLTGHWWRPLAVSLAALLALMLGGFVAPVQAGVISAVRALFTLQFVQPWWLLLLLVLPVLVRFSYQSLAGLGPVRRWVALSARCLVVALLVLALAEPRMRRTNEHLCVLYVLDRSMSVPQEVQRTTAGDERDVRLLRLQRFINSAVQERGVGHRNDLSGAILFARRPKLVLPPSPVDKLWPTDAMAGRMDPNYTDIAAAIKLAMASFPEGTGKRIVLLSDGNENLGNAEDQAALARQNGVEIDAVPLGEGTRQENEVLVQAVEAPPQTAKGARLPVHVLIRNANPTRVITGKLELMQNREGVEKPLAMVGRGEKEQSPYPVELQPGLNRFTFRDKAEGGKKSDEELSYSYRAHFTPDPALPGDRIQNNRAMAHVIARGARRVLFLEPDTDEDGNYPHQHLIDQLRVARFLVLPRTVGQLPQNRDELAVYLSNFDCMVIADVPAERFTPTQHEAIRSNTYDQGCGLVFVGGPESYGAGGYQKTAIEAALPVDCEIKALKAAGRGGLVLVMHASEMADGNKWQKEVAKLAIDRLSPIDMIGVLYYDGSTKWHIPFQQVGDNKAGLKAQVDKMVPGDMMDFDPFLKAAYDTLTDPQHGLAVKHCIVISDGDPQLNAVGLKVLADMRAAAVTCSAVGVATHSAAEDGKLTKMAEGAARGGKYYKVVRPEDLPAIYMRESRRVSQSFLYTKEFNPKLVLRSGATDKLDSPLPDLFGFVRTTLKPSPLAEMHIEGPRTFDQRFPILATWQYGLGRSAAFTSDARTIPGKQEGWDRRWAGSEMYLKFWEQVVGWAMRGLETDRLVLTTEYREGRVRVMVEARDENNRPMTDLRLDGKVSSPGDLNEGQPPIELKFEQRAGGYYEAEFKAEEAGSYIVNAQARQRAPAYTGRFRSGLPTTVTETDGQLRLADGTLVRRGAGGTLLYADDGTPVKIEPEVERVVDSRRTGVTISYSPEFADLEPNTALLRSLARITGGEVHSEARLDELAASGQLYRPAPQGTRALSPLWYWLVFVAAVGLLIDVGVRRISLEPHEVRQAADRTWARLRKTQVATAAGDDDAFLARLRQKKAVVEESLERERAGRKFEATGPPTEPPPPGADDGDVGGAPAFRPPPPPPPPPTARSAEEPADDFFSKLRKAKRRAPHERDREED